MLIRPEPDNGKHERLYAGYAELVVLLVGFILEDVLHDEDDILNQKGVGVRHYGLRVVGNVNEINFIDVSAA